MDILNIQALIKEGKIVSLADIDPTKTYIQIGVFQSGNRLNGAGNANTFAPFAIPLDALVAPVSPCCPTLDADGNLITVDNSNNTVNVAPGGTHLVDNFSGTVIVNDHYDGGMEMWICGGGDCKLVQITSASPGNSTFTMNGSGYEWTNVDNLNGPFTFTVVKTRNGS